MTSEIESPEPLPHPRVVHHRAIAPIWLLPLVALVIGGWLVWRSLLNVGPTIQIEFENAEGVVPNQTQVRYRGIAIGVVKRLDVLDNLQGVVATVEFDKKIDKVMEGTQFWLVQPQISVSGISGLNTLFSGNYIGVQPGKDDAPAKTYFKALKQAPPLPASTPGLHLKLKAARLDSIVPGTPVYFRQVAVGSVQSATMNPSGDGVGIDVHILPEYQKFVHKTTRFWNASGLRISANLSGLRIDTESLAALIGGGIAMSASDEGDAPAANGDSFTLYPDYDAAEAGLRVNVHFNSAEGLSEGVTKVMYKGIQVGKVLKLGYDESTDLVVARVGIDPRLEPFLTDQSRFWLVKPQLSIAGVSGIDALLTGTYLNFSPDNSGKATREFFASDGPSALDYRAPGLHVLLTAPELGSLNQGSPVYYRQLQVGKVVSYTLDQTRDKVDIHVLIDPEYAALVNESTRFWNAGGISLNAGLSGVKIRTESLAALIAGGIAFDTPEPDKAKAVGNGFRFTLFRDEYAARARVLAHLHFTSAEGLVEGQTRVVYRGLPIGQVEKVRVSKDFRTVDADVAFSQDAEHLLTEASQFWLVKPEVSVNRIAGLDAILSGAYIAIQPGEGKPARDFVARLSPPPLPMSEPGLHLVLDSSDAGAVAIGTPVLHKKVNVGSVQDVRLAPDGKGVQVFIHIKPEHSAAVTSASRFWRAGGFEIKGGLSGVQVRTESLAAVIAGGLAFDNFGGGAEPHAAKSGDRFKIYDSHDEAENAGFPVALRLESAEGLTPGTPIRYKGVDIGEITHLSLSPGLDQVLADAMLRQSARALMRESTRFWQVKPQLGLARVQHLDALVTGQYLELRPGTGAERFEFTVAEREPVLTALDSGLNLVLTARGLGSLKCGDPILFRQLKVGEIIGTDLSPAGDEVRIYINIEPAYAHLVRSGSKFWQASGLRIDAGLFSGIDIHTESLESLVAGGIAFATPEGGEQARGGETFALFEQADNHWLRWAPVLESRAGATETSRTR